MTTESQILEAPVPEAVEGPACWYVFCPEEPTLIIIVNDETLRFSNGRYLIDMSKTGAGQTLEFFRKAIPRFVVASTLDAPELYGILHIRLVETFARMAGASNPAKVMQEVEIAIRIMLNRPKGKESARLTDAESLHILARAMPATIKDHMLPPQQFADAAAQSADEAVMKEAVKGVDMDTPPEPPPPERANGEDEPSYDPTDEVEPEAPTPQAGNALY